MPGSYGRLWEQVARQLLAHAAKGLHMPSVRKRLETLEKFQLVCLSYAERPKDKGCADQGQI